MDPRVLAAPAPDLTAWIGNTPLVPIGGLEGVPGSVSVLGKAEWLNPGGSVKDRAAWGMVRAAEAREAPGRRDRVLLDATSGNTGIALAWIGAARGHRVHLCVPANANTERRRLLAALGAEVTLTDPLEGTDGSIREAQRLAAAEPVSYLYLDQYSNEANWRAHVEGTAREIWTQSHGRITHFVAGIGTSGTLVGTARGLRELAAAAGNRAPGGAAGDRAAREGRASSIEIIAVQPDSPYHALEGLKHLGSAIVPPIYDPSAHDRMIEVASDAAIDMVRLQARRGLLLGWSAGAAVVAAAQMAREIEHGCVVCVLPDGAERYLSEPLWQEP
ncbi:MAG: PLP-dependent cysteine synthase family protein [Candidatus Eisenbacteria bacterium]